MRFNFTARPALPALMLICSVLLLFSGHASAQESAPPAPPKPSSPALERAGEIVNPPKDFHEDLNNLSLETSHLHPTTPVFGAKDDAPGSSFIRWRFQVSWRPGDPMDLYVIRPRGVEKPPVNLYLYTFPDDTERFMNDHWCAAVTSHGYAAIGFVSALTGHRIGTRPLNEWFIGQLPDALVMTVHDVTMILNYLDSRGDFDMSRVGMFGQGSGGTVAILASTVEPRIKSLDLLTPWADWPEFMAKSHLMSDTERPDFLKPAYLAAAAPWDPVLWFSKVKASRVRLQDVRKTPAVPDIVQVKLEDAAPQIAVINQFGDGRAFYPFVAGGKIFDWIQGQEPPAAAQDVSDSSKRVHYYPPAEQTIH